MNSQHANLLQLFVGEIPFFFDPGFLYVPDPDLLGNPADLFHGQTQQVSRSRLRYVLWNFITVLHEASPTAGILALRSASTPLVMVLTEVHVAPTPILISA